MWANLLSENIPCKSPADSGWRAILEHYSDVIMSTMASQIYSLTIIYLSVYSGLDQRKYQWSAALAFVRGMTGKFPAQKGPVTRKMFPFDHVIMKLEGIKRRVKMKHGGHVARGYYCIYFSGTLSCSQIIAVHQSTRWNLRAHNLQVSGSWLLIEYQGGISWGWYDHYDCCTVTKKKPPKPLTYWGLSIPYD